MNHYFKRQTSGKRFLSGLLDLVFVLLLSVFLYVPAVHITNAAGWAESYQELYKYGATSGLYKQNDMGGLDTINEYEDMPKALYLFYVDHPDEHGVPFRGYSPLLTDDPKNYNSADDFYDVILRRGKLDTLFNFPLFESGSYEPYNVPQLSGKTNEVETFLFNEMEKAYGAFNEYPIVNQLLFDNYRYQAVTIAMTYLTSALILIVLLPLILKDKVTLGKLVTKTIVLDRFGYKIKPGRAFARNLSVFLLSFVFFVLPFHIVSFLFGMFGKKKESLFDMIAFTIVADKNDTIAFRNVSEENAHRKRLAQSLLTIEQRKAENRQVEIAEKKQKFEENI